MIASSTSFKFDSEKANRLNLDTGCESSQILDRATGWIDKLTTSAPELQAVSEALVGSRADMMDKVRDLGLPHIPYTYATTEEFLDNPENFTRPLKGKSYFVTIQPTDYGAPVDSPEPGIASLSEVLEKTRRFTKQNTGHEYTVVLSEVKDVAYLGNIVINENGDIHGEFTDEGIPPTRSSVTSLYSFSKDQVLDVFRYSFEDPELRAAIYKSVSSLPHIGTGRERTWEKGYYELNLVRSETGALQPAFYDFRDSEPFLFVPKQK